MAPCGSLAPWFVNDDCGTAEMICSTACVRHKSSLGHRLLCDARLAPPIKQRELKLCHGCDCWVSQERGHVRLCCVMSAATAAAPARRE